MKIMGRPIKLVAPTLTLAIGLAQVAGLMLFPGGYGSQY